MKKIIALIISVIFVMACFSACSKEKSGAEKQKFSETFIDYFDTVSTVVGYADTAEEFNSVADEIEALLREYHELYDIYNSYSGKNNVCTINKNAGAEPVVVDKKIIELLDFSKEMFNKTGGKTDITMGALLKLWHNAREKASFDPESAYIPSEEEILEAKELRGFEKIVIDRENSTVFITEKGVSLDVGAVAKGYAAEQIAKYLEGKGVSGYALSLGGNIRVVGDKPNGERWTASIADPWNESNPGTTINMLSSSIVTSGSYQRYFDYESKRYHHIIDPDTGYPYNEFVSVSVICDDSGVADCLSTALFSMSYEEGRSLVDAMEGVEVAWITSEKEEKYTDGFEKYLENN